MLYKNFDTEIKAYDDNELIVEHFISTEAKDRVKDIMRADGMYMTGKVSVLLQHGKGITKEEPIAMPLSITPGTFNGKKGLIAKTKYYDGSHLDPPDNTGRRLYEKARDGYMSNWSIGYIPVEWIDIDNGTGRDITKWELLEYSQVSVPMNPEAQTLREYRTISFKVMPEGSPDVIYADIEAKNDLNGIEEKPYPNEHACRLTDPSKYDKIRRQNDKFGTGIHAIFGVKGNKSELQAIRFDESKFTPEEAKKWCKDHNHKCIAFEATSKNVDITTKIKEGEETLIKIKEAWRMAAEYIKQDNGMPLDTENDSYLLVFKNANLDEIKKQINDRFNALDIVSPFQSYNAQGYGFMKGIISILEKTNNQDLIPDTINYLTPLVYPLMSDFFDSHQGKDAIYQMIEKQGIKIDEIDAKIKDFGSIMETFMKSPAFIEDTKNAHIDNPPDKKPKRLVFQKDEPSQNNTVALKDTVNDILKDVFNQQLNKMMGKVP